MPPHPSFKSCFRIKGDLRLPSKSNEIVGWTCSFRDGTSSSGMVKAISEPLEVLVDNIGIKEYPEIFVHAATSELS